LATRDDRLVFVVDDDRSLRRSLRNLLTSAGYRVETFASAEALLESGLQEYAACLVLDLGMPGMSGLELLDHLSATGSHLPVIVVTAQAGNETRQRALSGGAVAFLEKPFDSSVLFDAVRRAIGVDGRPLRFAGGTLGAERHVAAFFNGLEEQHQVLRSFIKDGVNAGDKAFHIVNPDLRDDHLRRLAEAGIDVHGTMATGQLEVRPWQEAYLRGDRFEQDAMLAMVEEVLRSNAAAGYPVTRVLAHMEWALLDKQGVDDLVEYETRLNYVLPKYDDPVICTYDLSKFGSSVAMDVMRTHPVAIIGGVLQENPFFVPPDQFLLEMRERRSAQA